MSTPLTTDDQEAAPINTEHLLRARRERLLGWIMPVATLAAAIAFWEWAV